MLREKLKWRSHKSESTDAGHRGGATRSSDEVSVMEMERRGCIDRLYRVVNQRLGGTI
jgi:RNA-directed DNA polymerase